MDDLGEFFRRRRRRHPRLEEGGRGEAEFEGACPLKILRGGAKPPPTRFNWHGSAIGWLFVKIDIFAKTRFFHEWAPHGTWGGHRIVKIGAVAMRAFLMLCVSFCRKKHRVSGPWTFP